MEAQAEASRAEIMKNPLKPPPKKRKFLRENDTGSWAAYRHTDTVQEAEVV
jgi:hypothetical protein